MSSEIVIMILLWIMGIYLLIGAIKAVKEGKITLSPKGGPDFLKIYKGHEIKGKWARILGWIWLVMAGLLVISLIYNSIRCGGVLVICN
jgi:hypothetical protein